MRRWRGALLAVLAGCGNALTWAAAQPEQIGRLSGDLTPVGAERAGNADGEIPAWTGGLAGGPVGGPPADPFNDEAACFTVDARNAGEYRARLTPGQSAMLSTYADSYILRVCPSHRTAAYPERIYRMTARNGATGSLAAEGEGVTGVAEGFPFPFPENGRELMWNHKLRFRGTGSRRRLNMVAVTATGQFQPVRLNIETLSLYHQPGATLESTGNQLLYWLQTIESPPRLAGTLLLVHESLNQAAQPRDAWTYNPSQRRVIRAPNVAYDHPSTAADGGVVSDMADMFNGAMDRFEWELLGKRVLYVPYNANRAQAADPDYAGAARPGHLDPGLLRYEPHRVWVVEARLRPGLRHINPRRTYYLDEDSYQVLLAEHYDERGQLWRYSEAHPVVYQDVPMLWTALETHHDLQTRRYVSYRLDNRDGPARFDLALEPAEFSPQAMRRKAHR